MFDGATFIGPLSQIADADDPPEWNGIGGPNYYHDRAYYERRPNDRALVDRTWLGLMMLAADGLAGSNPERCKSMRKMARLRYGVVRTIGWIWWYT